MQNIIRQFLRIPIYVLLTIPAFAEETDILDMNLEDLPSLQVQSVYAASKFSQTTLKAPASVSIVTDEEIKRYGWRNFGEILSSVRGIHVGFDRSFYSGGVRGILQGDDFNDNGVLILVDGVRINDGILGAASISRDFLVDIDLIKKIEIIRGPGSVLYGANAFFAVVNVITKKAEDINGVEVLGSIGSKEEYRRRVSGAHTFGNGWSLTGSATGYDRDGESNIYFPYFDDPENNNGIAENADNDHLGNGFFELAKGNFRLQVLHSSRAKDIPEAPFEVKFNAPQDVKQSKTAIDAQYTKQFGEDWDLQLKSSYNRYLDDGNYVFDNSDEGDGSYFVNASEKFFGNYVSGEALISKKIAKMHTLSFGTEYRRNIRQDILVQEEGIYSLAPGLDTPDLNTVLNVQQASNEVGVFTQAEFELNKSLFLSTGVRYDYYDLVKSNDSINPRISLNYLPQEQTAIKLNYSSAFRVPSGFEYLYDDGQVSQKTPDSLDPEEIGTYEAVLEHYFDKNFSATTAIYHSEFRNSISLEQDPTDQLYVFRNGTNKITANGIEFGLQRNWSNGWQSRGSYAFQDNKDGATDKILVNSPQNLFKVNMIAPLIKESLYLGYEIQYAGTRNALSGTKADPYWLNNLTLSTDDLFFKNMHLQVSAYNLFGARIDNPGSNYQIQDFIRNEGRTYLTEIMYKF